MSSPKKHHTPSSQLIARLFRQYLIRHIPDLALATFFMAIAAIMTGAMAKMMEPIIDHVMKQGSTMLVLEVAVAVLLIFAIRGGATYVHTVMMNKIGQRIITDAQQDLYRHLLDADLSFYHANASGTLISRMTNDVGVMRQAVGECMTSSFRGGLTLAILIGVMFYQDWQLALGSFLVFPPSALMVAKLGKRMRRVSSSTQHEIGHFASFLSQTFQGIRHVKAYGMETKESGYAKKITEKIFELCLKGYRVSALSNPISELLSGFAIAAVIVYGGNQVMNGSSTPGELFSFITAFLLAYDPMKRMAKMNAQLQSGLAAAERLFSVFDIKPSIVDSTTAKSLKTSDYSIGIEGVSFSYPDGTQALRDITITVPNGKTVAIVGASGSGKSTIINLIPRFYDVQQGKVTVGGHDVRDLSLESLRDHIALVSQETALFDDTIRANIAYGKPDASDSEIESAAEAAFADGFIKQLPEGYATMVGELGVKLSGGQRQRVAIARAMLRNAPVLLLDEATSALDNESERAVQNALRRLQVGRTTIVVAHRLSTIVDSDLIVVLQAGQAVEQGTHTELMERGGTYAKLYGIQGNLIDNW
ncbi:MAG: ATP-binding cassette domain-containing protein [Alphaproteobacteria bacterium]|nr:ATP-binding cassette domain-containing protein [Alphaproteobacteria bacterium]